MNSLAELLLSKGVPVSGSDRLRTDVTARLEALGAAVKLRDFVTDNGCSILDASGLSITDPKALEDEINSWPGVVTVGLFAPEGVKTFKKA